MYILLFLNIVGIAIMISKYLSLKSQDRNSEVTATVLRNELNTDDKDSNAKIAIAKQTLSAHSKEMEKGLNTVKIIASISPLLGLLGTVVGVLVAFQVMSKSGLSDPANFAHGISMALITTVGGLIVAIPHFIGHHYLVGMLENTEAKIEKCLLDKVLQ